MPEETPSQLFERWRAQAAVALRELRSYKAQLDRFRDEHNSQAQRLDRLHSELTALIDQLGPDLDNVLKRLATYREAKKLNEGLAVAIDNLPSDEEIAALRMREAEVFASADRLNLAYREYQSLCEKSEAWLRYTPEPVQEFQQELIRTRITMEHVLYAIELGIAARGGDAKAHIMKYVMRHPDASDADICADLDSHDVPIPTKKWEARLREKYGTPLWNYSWEGDIEKSVPADEKLRHSTREYLWRYKRMGGDLAVIYKIKRTLKLRKLRLPEIKLPDPLK